MSLRVIISPLDWGLGHATRCVPIINYLIDIGAELMIAGSGRSGNWLQQKYPEILYQDLKTEEITYSNYWTSLSVGNQIPKFIKSLKKDQLKAEYLAKRFKPDLIISDNRYGFFVEGIRSVIISHQLQPKFPILNYFFRKKIEEWLLQFNEIWVPDCEDIKLSGVLSKSTERTKGKIKHIGLLSQFSTITAKNVHQNFDGFFLWLSGPENQRSNFHELVINGPYFESKNVKVVGNNLYRAKKPQHQEFGILKGEEMLSHFNPDNIVICRSGYSTLMDLAYLKAKAIFVPTPGISEQIYLAKRLEKRFNQVSIKQGNLKKERPDIFKNIRPFNIEKRNYSLFKEFI